MTRINIGVAGVGVMGQRHAENLARLIPAARLTAVSDFGPAGQPAEGDVGPTHVSSKYAFVPFALLGVFVVGLAAFALVTTVRNRRLIGSERGKLPAFPERFRRQR